MRRNFVLFIISFILLTMLSSCKRSWIIEIDGYTLHKTDGKYYIAQIPESVSNENIFDVPTHIGEYEISGLGSDRILGMWAGEERIELGKIRKINVKSNINSIILTSYYPLLIETEQPLSEIEIDSYDLDLNKVYFISPKENLEYNYVDKSDCYDGIVYEIKDDGNAKVLLNYSKDYIIHNEHKGAIVNEIGNYAFQNNNITEFTIPTSITTIGDYAFESSSLEKLTFNENIIEIGEYAFASNNIKELDLPNIELTIKSAAFKENKIEYINIPENILCIDSNVFSYNNIQSFKFESKYIYSISSGMFYGCPLTGTLDFGTRISKIEDNALSSNSREELVIPENIIYFGKLSYCHNLKKIYLPNRSITIGLFSYLDNLEELHLGGAKNFVCSERMNSENFRLITVSENNEYLYTENGILYDKKTNAILKCPPKLDIKKVEINVKPAESAFDCNIYIEEAIINCELSRSLFFRCSNLKKVELNDSIKEIPDFAFTTCVSLKEINLNNITEVGYNSFWRCESLNYVDLSNCEVVGVGAFEKCDLYEVVFTDKIQEIKNDAFANNKNLSKCNYYNAIIDDYSFYDTPLYNTREDNKEKFMNFLRRLFFFLI